MEPIQRKPQDITPGQPTPGVPGRPVDRRPVFNDFAPRRPAPPMNTPVRVPQPGPSTTPNPTPTSTPRPISLNPVPGVNPTPTAPSQTPAGANSSTEFIKPTSAAPAKAPKQPKHRSETGHAGLVGFITFVLLTALLLSPFLPSKILQNFPGNSQSFSTGDQSLACLHDLGKITTTQKYDTKLGSPIVYKYATTSTQHATCDGKEQTAVGGHTSQFNPLGLVIDIAGSFVVALIVTKVWRRVLGARD